MPKFHEMKTSDSGWSVAFVCRVDVCLFTTYTGHSSRAIFTKPHTHR